MDHKPIRGSDWKKFKVVREKALDRFCKRVLAEARSLCDDVEKAASERYGDLYELMQDRNKEMANAFDSFSRSRATLQLMVMRSMDLVPEEEISEFSPELQRASDPPRQ